MTRNEVVVAYVSPVSFYLKGLMKTTEDSSHRTGLRLSTRNLLKKECCLLYEGNSKRKGNVLVPATDKVKVHNSYIIFQRSLPAVPHTFVAVHKLPASIGEGFRLFRNPLCTVTFTSFSLQIRRPRNAF